MLAEAFPMHFIVLSSRNIHPELLSIDLNIMMYLT